LVVGVTGNVLEDDIAEYLDAGADLVLSKPIKFTSLMMLLRFGEAHGFVSQPNMTLVEHGNHLEWVSRITGISKLKQSGVGK
jgi:CheY-like chemotaxis protein